MNENKINIISFNIPFPANYGGVIDVFYKIKTLHDLGFKIVLHCFEYGRKRQPELEKYCSKVYYYTRKKGIQYLISKLPYIVLTRANGKLLENLKSNNYPILFEGLHSCYCLDNPELKDRKKLVRMHNIEHDYYTELAKATNNIFKKIFFHIESFKLKKYQNILSHANAIFAISKNDFNYLIKKQSEIKVELLPAFHAMQNITSKTGKGNYFLYHGNLSVEENEKAVLYLLNDIVPNTGVQFVIAGKSPGQRIVKAAQSIKNVELKADPDEVEMDKLISNAQACILPTFQATGLKLKLLLSLFAGRHVIVNSEMVENTGLEFVTELANSKVEFIQKIEEVKELEFSEKDIQLRKEVLKSFTNKTNGDAFIKILNDL